MWGKINNEITLPKQKQSKLALKDPWLFLLGLIFYLWVPNYDICVNSEITFAQGNVLAQNRLYFSPEMYSHKNRLYSSPEITISNCNLLVSYKKLLYYLKNIWDLPENSEMRVCNWPILHDISAIICLWAECNTQCPGTYDWLLAIYICFEPFDWLDAFSVAL